MVGLGLVLELWLGLWLISAGGGSALLRLLRSVIVGVVSGLGLVVLYIVGVGVLLVEVWML